jgi:hypothetical protein
MEIWMAIRRRTRGASEARENATSLKNKRLAEGKDIHSGYDNKRGLSDQERLFCMFCFH